MCLDAFTGRRRFAYLLIITPTFYEYDGETAKEHFFVFVDAFDVSSFIYR